jgi:uncharacterized protein YqjF (DUF2071 family)
MPDSRPFLTAEWKNLLMLNYVVDAALLEPLVPAGTELDWFSGKAWLSLIGFKFNRTRVLGFAVPFHQDFEEVNVRFYVRREAKRGVVFISELVPKRAIAAVARLAFNEKYRCVPMDHRVEYRADGQVARAEYEWGFGEGRCAIRTDTEGQSFLPEAGSASEFITEHYWGYAAQKDWGCLEYEVRHPQWQVWSAKGAEFSGDGAAYYGPEIGSILTRQPDSAFLAKGSPVTVGKGTRIA